MKEKNLNTRYGRRLALNESCQKTWLESRSGLHHLPDGAVIWVGSRFQQSGQRWVGKKILIVDDCPSLRKTLRKALETDGGWQCFEAVNGKDGVERAGWLSPELVILDLSMAVMNGLQAARELRRLFPALPLVMFTTFETAHLEGEALDAGVTSLFSKSEPIGNLIRTIHSLLDPAD
ncbi:MAG TPA: response regulator transcription factor [Candidatus Binatia bacterium]|nr:response regulator transcription factor [Candidatus Binatia bacterium]